MKIPLINLKKQHVKLKNELSDLFKDVLDNNQFILGKHVEEFEKNFGNKIFAHLVVGCSNGTAAIAMALECLGIGNGDEVITVSNTFFSTAEAICNVGAVPVFVDICPYSYTIDVNKINSAITNKTKAIIPVHLYGTPCKMKELMNIANKNNLFVIEDCAQSHLAKIDNKFTGTFGEFGTFSFYPGKNLGALGDAGCITVKHNSSYKFLKKIRNHGRVKKYKHDLIGYNNRMDEIQAAILNFKLRYLSTWTDRRIQNAKLYDKFMDENNIKRLIPNKNSESVYHLYVIEVNKRDELIEFLGKKGISCGIHYPIPLHLQKPLKEYGLGLGSLPVTESVSKKILSLPMCPELNKEEIHYICSQIKLFFNK